MNIQRETFYAKYCILCGYRKLYASSQCCIALDGPGHFVSMGRIAKLDEALKLMLAI